MFSVEGMPARSALLVGVGQCLAMIPGVSRSGATIMSAMLLKIDRKTAAEFSFFLAVPTIAGATVLLLWKNRDSLDTSQMSAIGIGFPGVVRRRAGRGEGLCRHRQPLRLRALCLVPDHRRVGGAGVAAGKMNK